MPIVKTDSKHYSNIANAIRTKKGVNNTYTPAQMPEEILSIASVSDIQWNQCPEAVKNYIENVDYTNVPYTESEIGEYAPTPAVLSNTKPIGKSVDGIIYYNNVPGVKTPFASSNEAGTLKPLDKVRWINSKTSNFRDLGGWACDGGTVKYGLIYRSGELNVNDEDLIINQLGIKTEIDLTADGIPAYGDKMRFVGHTSYAMYTLGNPEAWRVNLRGIFDAVKFGDPVIFHCSMGADRTGTLACILEGLLGVSQSDIDKDYELTSFYSMRARNGNYQGGSSDWTHLIFQITALSGSTFRDKVVNFVISLGFTVDEINAFRKAMIDGNPEILSPTIPTATITKTLSNVTIDNSASSMNQYQPYRAILTPASGYIFDSVTVTMGGVNITSSVYVEEVFPNNRGLINISQVTGNIVVTATATQGEIPNLFDSTDPDVSLRGRINSSGNAVAYADNQLVTGFISAAVGDVFQIETDKSLKTNSYTGMAAIYTSSKSFIGAMSNGSTTVWTFTDSDMSGRLTIPQTLNGKDYSGTAYVRFCVAYTNIDNIRITKQ